MKNYVFCVVDRIQFVNEASVQHNVEELNQETQYNEDDANSTRCSISALDLNMSSLSTQSIVDPRNGHIDLTLEAESEPFDTNQSSEEDILDTSKYFKNYEDYNVDKNGFVTNEEELEEEITSDSPYAFDSLQDQDNESEHQSALDESDTDSIKQMYNNIKNFERQEVSDENFKSTPREKPSSGSFKKKFGKFLMHLFLPKKPIYVRAKNREYIPQTSTDNTLGTSSVTVHQHTKLKFNPRVSTLVVKDSDSLGNREPIKEEKTAFLVDHSEITATNITRVSKNRKISKKVKKKIKVANAELFKDQPNVQQ